MSKEEHIICIKKEVLQNELEFHILKVPEYYRQLPTEYTPVAWRFGLHNREDLGMSGSEGVKLSIAAGYQFTDDVDGIRSFCEAVVPNPKSMLVCYGLHEMVPKLDDEEIKQVLALDALFLASRIDTDLLDRRLWITELGEMPNEKFFLPIFDRWKPLVDIDLCKIENQIPFDLIKRAIKHITRLTKPAYEDEGCMVNDANCETNPLYEDQDHPINDANSETNPSDKDQDHPIDDVNSETNPSYEDQDHPINGEQVHGSALDELTQLAKPKEGFVKRVMKCIMKCLNPKEEGIDSPDSNVAIADIPYLEQWMKQAVNLGTSSFMEITDDFYKNTNANMKLSQSHHILDAAYKAICGVDGIERISDYDKEGYIHVPSATKLKQSGIKIVGVTSPLYTMSYDTKTKQLSLPKMRMYDETVALVRNIARYEEYSQEDKCMFHDYIFFMLDLIDTAQDFKFLSTKCGVIDNECGSRGFEMWNALNQNLAILPSSKEHNAMKEAINKRYKLHRYRMWSEFKTLFLSRPWLTVSAIAAILVTVATLIQTYAGVINTNGMKPHYNP